MNDFVWLHNLGFGLFFSIPGVLFLVAGCLILRSSYSEMRSWTTASGTVIGYKEVQQGRRYGAQGKFDPHPPRRDDTEPAKWTAYHPQFQFATADGTMISFTSSAGSNRKPYQ